MGYSGCGRIFGNIGVNKKIENCIKIWLFLQFFFKFLEQKPFTCNGLIFRGRFQKHVFLCKILCWWKQTTDKNIETKLFASNYSFWLKRTKRKCSDSARGGGTNRCTKLHRRPPPKSQSNALSKKGKKLRLKTTGLLANIDIFQNRTRCSYVKRKHKYYIIVFVSQNTQRT